MRFFKYLTAFTVLIGLALTTTAAHAVVIDFDDYTGIKSANNELDGTEYAGLGVIFSTPGLALNLGDTPVSGPHSLGADSSNVNDFDGQINIQFTGGLSYLDVTFSIFNTPYEAKAFDINGTLLSTLSSAGGAFTQLFDFSGFLVNRIEVTGVLYAIDDLSFSDSVSAVPLPAAFPLYGAGIALLGFMAWRKKRAISS
ncbi:MAG: hypothetical protein V7750_13670 [Sneathiella sp.]